MASNQTPNTQPASTTKRKRGLPHEGDVSRPKRGLPHEGIDPRPKRGKRGAPKGNNNALKHGFYARQISDSDLAGLDQTHSTSLEDEIEVMRIFMRRVVELGSQTADLEKAINLLRILTFASMGINRLVRTQITLADPANEGANVLRTALAELENEWPELHECKEQFRNSVAENIQPLP